MKNFLNWLITSSADPEKTAATFKGLAMVAIGYAVKTTALACGFGLLCLQLDADVLTQAVNGLSIIITGGLWIVGGVMTVYGLWRKVSVGRWSAAQ